MNSLRVFSGFVLIAFLTMVQIVTAQTANLPKFKKGESYKSVRVKMLKAGWKPHRAPDADECLSGDDRCQNRPEMQSCAGTGLAPCRFLWKRQGKTVVIFTLGENVVYNKHEFQ